MERRKQSRISPKRSYDQTELASLIASGEASFPMDADLLEQERLAVQVRQIRSERLVRYLARLIALAIHRSEKGVSHVPPLRSTE